MQRHDRAMVDDIDEMDRGEAGRGALLGPMADPADMEAVAQRHHGDPVLGRAGDALAHRLVGDRLAEAALAVQHQDRPLRLDHPGRLVGQKDALGQAADIERQHADAVGIVAGEIGADQMVRDQCCLARLAAGGGADGRGQAMQRQGGHDRHGPALSPQRPPLARAATKGVASSMLRMAGGDNGWCNFAMTKRPTAPGAGVSGSDRRSIA